MKWVLPAAAALAAVVAAALFLRAPRGPNVLLITLDTTRADRLGCYGYAAARTPALDRLAAEGVRFDRAYTHVPLTLPSHTTIMTGLLPPEHGLRDNARGALGPEVHTIAEVFRKQGYATGAFVASFVLDRQFGLDRGFREYDDRMNPPARGDNSLGRENPADVVCERALRWLERNARWPFFCWVHFYDPHDPYDPPVRFHAPGLDPYDGEIAFVDSQVARLLQFLDRRGLDRKTIVLVCGDHGEAFGEHGETGHGLLLYETTMRVPLILRAPGRAPRVETKRVARLIDIAPTLLEALGQPKFPGQTGLSLLADVRTAEMECYGESLYGFYAYRWAPLHSLTGTRWKYVDGSAAELFDLSRDPAEQRNLKDTESRTVARLKDDLDGMRAIMKQGHGRPVALIPGAMAKLRSLGYAAGSSTTPDEREGTAHLKDPRQMAAAVHLPAGQARQLIAAGQHQQAVALLVPIVNLSPESPEIHEMLADCYLTLGQPTNAVPHIQAFLALDPGNRTMLANLGGTCLEAGRFDEAIRLYRQVLSLPFDPREPVVASGASKIELKARANMAVALTQQGALDAAAEQYCAILAADPGHLEACNNLGNIHVRQGRLREAIVMFRRCLDLDPNLFLQRENLGRLLWDEKQYGDALAAWREGLRRRPGEPVYLYHLGWRLATCPEAQWRNATNAVRYAEELSRRTGEVKAQALDCLAAAYAEAGDFAKAAATVEKALGLAQAVPEGVDMAREIEKRIALYRNGKPYRE